MYMDPVIAFGLLIILLTFAVVVYVGIYAWKHIKQDIQANVAQTVEQKKQ